MSLRTVDLKQNRVSDYTIYRRSYILHQVQFMYDSV